MMKRILLALATASMAASSVADVPYPEGYREWPHVKSMVIGEGHELYGAFGGIHHIYANAEAMAGYKAGRFADGAVIVFDLLDVTTANAGTVEGARKIVGVMHKDSKQFAATGGWGFEGFKGGDPTQRAVPAADAATACFACHQAKKDNDYVFSALRP